MKFKVAKIKAILLVMSVFALSFLAAGEADSSDSQSSNLSTNLTTKLSTKEGINLDTVSSLAWGEVLFYYFSGDKMQSLIRLYARESRSQLAPHQAQADLLAAGLLLDLGLALEAEKRLIEIGTENLSPSLNSRLALIMARVYFQRQDILSSQRWLDRVQDELLPNNELLRKKMMYAQVLFDQEKFLEAAKQLENIENKGNLQLYAEYNFGLSLLQLSDENAQATGRRMLTRLSAIDVVDQEQYALIDQAKLALGMDAVNLNQPLLAREHFIGIRLDGLVSNDALLLVGWTFAQTDAFDSALTYWNRLALKQDIFEPTVQESWLAVPYAHQKLGDLSSAVAGYERAIALETQALDELDMMMNSRSWRVLLSNAQAQEKFIASGDFPRAFRRQLIADPRFYYFLEEWQELSLFESKLTNSLSILPTLALVLRENERRYIQKSYMVKKKLQANPAAGYQQELQVLENEYQQQKSQLVAEKLLSDEHYGYWEKLENVQYLAVTINESSADKVSAEKLEQIRRLKGVANWQFHRQSDANRWAVGNNLSKLRKSITELSSRLKTLHRLSNRPSKSSIEALKRVELLQQRGSDLISQVELLKSDLEQAMSDEFKHFVSQRREALIALAEQANVALARLRFRAIKESFNNG